MKPRSLFAVLLGFVGPVFSTEPLPDSIDFSRDVRPILSNACFKCHGFDDKARQANRRLDTRDGALAELEGVRAIVPGKLADSDVHIRINSNDRDEIMPPVKSGKKLTSEQKAILDKWIEQGAPYSRHWAFEPVPQPVVPTVRNPSAIIRNPIDAFVLARLESEGLEPSPEANRYALVRRVSLDLIGLPPTPDEADAFLKDASNDAYERLVDRLLASPHYGERWARRWLDLARYADTNGYEKDRGRSIWPWRDWVINALNADMPFDQFTIEQLAGDMLPNATLEQRIATGFHRNTMLNEEGGIDPLEFRFHAMTDRVATTGATWLGLTVGCAQCHTHKYDPILHREYYQLMAFLNNADEPDLDIPPPDFVARRQAHNEKLARLIAELPGKWPLQAATKIENGADVETSRRAAVEAKFTEWLARERARSVVWIALRPVEATSNMPLLSVQPDNSVFASGDITKSDTYALKFADAPAGITAVRLEVLPDDRLPKHGPGLAYYEGPKGDFFLAEFQLSAAGQIVKFHKATESYAKNAMGNNPVSAALAIDGDPQTGWSTSGREGEAHEAVFQLEGPLPSATELRLKMMFGRHYACSLGRFRLSVTTDTRETEARDLGAELENLLTIPDGQLAAAQRERLRQHFLLTAPELAEARAEIDKLRRSAPMPLTTLVLRERPAANPRPTFLHKRGEFLQTAERVDPGVLSVLPPLPPAAKPDRLAFARWLVTPENPLTARVTVNRQWAILFGRGLVKTTEDFGLQGEPPTHPELLDWLARQFIEQGWSMKKLHRLIVTSATYRQSARVTPELVARDPDNRWLERGPRGRLEAEQVRDAVLCAAGLLSPKIGGPSVYPPQVDGVSEVAYGSPKWQASTGEDRFRRGLYTFVKRTAPYAMFSTFDAPTGEACVARRETSNTPLQALTLLNDVVLTEAAQALGKIAAARSGNIEDRVVALFRRCLTRPPNPDELTTLTRFFENQKRRLVANELDPVKIAGAGEGDVVERAAWTTLARAILNLDEAITRS